MRCFRALLDCAHAAPGRVTPVTGPVRLGAPVPVLRTLIIAGRIPNHTLPRLAPYWGRLSVRASRCCLAKGDVVRCEIEEIGAIENHARAE